MSSITKTNKLRWLGAAAAGALALAVVAVPLTPAKAYIGVDVGGVGIGIGGPYYGPGPYYYGPGPYYGYGPYHRHYYGYGW